MASARPVVLLAGGIGLTPLLAMIQYLASEGFRRETWLYYGVRNRSEHVFKSYFESLDAQFSRFHLTVCYAEPSDSDVLGVDYHHAGVISRDLLSTELGTNNFEFYLCGPPPMMGALLPALDEWGVPEDDVHYEAFSPASIRSVVRAESAAVGTDAAGRIQEFEIKLGKSGRSFRWQPQHGSILAAAEANGISIDAGCRAGNCGTCLTAVQSGGVRHAKPPGVEVDEGSCLVCIAEPKSDVVLDV